MDTRHADWDNFLANVRTTEETIFQPEHLNKIANPELKHLALGVKMVLQSFSRVSEVIQTGTIEPYIKDMDMDLAELDNGLENLNAL